MDKWLLKLSPLLILANPALAATGEGNPRMPGTPEPAPVVQAPALDSSHLVDTIIGLVLVLALMLALAWVVKRYASMPGLGKGKVQVLGGTSLGPRERAVLVEVEGQRLLLGVAPGRVQTLHVLGAEPQPDESDKPGDFAEQLEKASQEDAS